jgi:hypothetical protein
MKKRVASPGYAISFVLFGQVFSFCFTMVVSWSRYKSLLTSSMVSQKIHARKASPFKLMHRDKFHKIQVLLSDKKYKQGKQSA